VEKANQVAGQRFWRTLADDVSLEAAQGRLDTWWPATATPGPVHPRRARYGTDKVGYVDMLKAYRKFDDRPMI
jgi:hypothetical protein